MSLLKKLPIKRFKIKENSMLPLYRNGDEVFVVSYIFYRPKVGDVIIFNQSTPPHVFIKRIVKVFKDKYWVEGDNKKESINSRSIGYIKRNDIIGKVVMKI